MNSKVAYIALYSHSKTSTVFNNNVFFFEKIKNAPKIVPKK